MLGQLAVARGLTSAECEDHERRPCMAEWLAVRTSASPWPKIDSMRLRLWRESRILLAGYGMLTGVPLTGAPMLWTQSKCTMSKWLHAAGLPNRSKSLFCSPQRARIAGYSNRSAITPQVQRAVGVGGERSRERRRVSDHSAMSLA